MNSQRVSEFMSRNTGEREFSKSKLANIIAYPQNSVIELAQIMKDIQVECLPVFFSPWNRKVIGFIELNKISVFLND